MEYEVVYRNNKHGFKASMLVNADSPKEAKEQFELNNRDEDNEILFYAKVRHDYICW